MTRQLIEMSLVEASEALGAGSVSSVELVQACLDRAADVQPTINCFISIETEDALTAAKQADAEIARDERRGVLHGIPLAHKDMFYRAGKVSTFGSKIFRDYTPDFTSTVMDRLAAAGAIYLGGLNMAEFATGPVGQNDHFGQIRNPWNTEQRVRRIIERFGGSARRAGVFWRAGLGHGWLLPSSRRHVRCRRAQAHLRADQPSRRTTAVLDT